MPDRDFVELSFNTIITHMLQVKLKEISVQITAQKSAHRKASFLIYILCEHFKTLVNGQAPGQPRHSDEDFLGLQFITSYPLYIAKTFGCTLSRDIK